MKAVDVYKQKVSCYAEWQSEHYTNIFDFMYLRILLIENDLNKLLFLQL